MFSKFKKLLVISMLSLPMLSLASNYYKNELQGKEVVVASSVIPPYVIVNPSDIGTPIGIEIDILKEAQKRLGFSFKKNRIVFTSQNGKYDMIVEGIADIVIGGIWGTDARHDEFDFSTPIYKTSLSIITRKDKTDKIRGLDDLVNTTIAGEVGTRVLTQFSEDERSQKISQKWYDSLFNCFYAVEKGDVDAFIYDTPTAKYYLNKWNDHHLTTVGDTFGNEHEAKVVFLYHKTFKYQEQFNAVIEEMLYDGTIDSIVNKYIK